MASKAYFHFLRMAIKKTHSCLNCEAQLTASEGDSYQWYLNGEPIEGATELEYEALESGDYSVQVTIDFPCAETSSSMFILVSSIDELSNSPI